MLWDLMLDLFINHQKLRNRFLMNLAKYLEVWFTLYCTNTEQLKQRKASISLQMRTKNEQTYIANTQ